MSQHNEETEIEGELSLTRTLTLTTCTFYSEQIMLALKICSVRKDNQTAIWSVQSLRGICSEGTWRHLEEFEQVVAALSVIRYTTAATPGGGEVICWPEMC